MKLSVARTTLMNESDKYGEKIAVVYEHTNRIRDAVRRLGKIIQSIFCAQSGASIRQTVWKWYGESRYPGGLPLMDVRETGLLEEEREDVFAIPKNCLRFSFI